MKHLFLYLPDLCRSRVRGGRDGEEVSLIMQYGMYLCCLIQEPAVGEEKEGEEEEQTRGRREGEEERVYVNFGIIIFVLEAEE